MYNKTRKKVYDTEVIARRVLTDYLGNKCYYCGGNTKLQLHHKTPRSVGGKDVLSNIQLLCFKCHIEIHKQLRKVINYRTAPEKTKRYKNIDKAMVIMGYLNKD